MITKKIQNTEHNSISDTIIEVLDTAFLKALTDPTRITNYQEISIFWCLRCNHYCKKFIPRPLCRFPASPKP